MTDIMEYASFKRLLECYSADPLVKSKIDEGRFTTKDAEQMGLLVSNIEGATLAIKAIIYGIDTQLAASDMYYREYVRINQIINKLINDSVDAKAYATGNNLYEFGLLTSRRCGMEKEVIRLHPNIHYFPLCFELSEGCKVQCDFCGFEAGRFVSYFEYNEANRTLWREILAISRDVVGDVARTAPFYFATEPFDNPDYISFLKDGYEILGDIPQTTTALAEAFPERIREIMEFDRKISKENSRYKAHLRFSIRNLKQLKKIHEIYSPMELLDVELLANNPESVNRYSASGRVLDKPSVSQNKKNEYSICCISGIKVNMVTGTMEFIEPEVPCPEYPKGYRVRETLKFANAGEFKEKLRLLYDKYAVSKLPEDRSLEINKNVREITLDSKIAFAGDNTGIAFTQSYVLSETLKMISAGRSICDIISLMGLFGDSRTVLIRELNRMFRGGYIRIK